MVKCVFCDNLDAKFQCKQCLEYYCCKNCQVMDWAKHKYICQKKAVPINIDENNQGERFHFSYEDKSPKSFLHSTDSFPSNYSIVPGSERSSVLEKGLPTSEERKHSKQNGNESCDLSSQISEIKVFSTKSNDQPMKLNLQKNNEIKRIFNINDTSLLTNLKENFQIKIFHKLNLNFQKALAVIIDEKVQNDLSDLTEKLNADNNSHYDIHDVKEIPIQSVIAAKYDEKLWRRCLYLGNYKKDYLVLFIDDGKMKIIKQIKYLPEEFSKICNLTVCIEFSNYDSEINYMRFTKELSTLSCKIKEPIDKNNNLHCVVYASKEKIGEAFLKPFDGNYRNFRGTDTYTYPFDCGNLVQITKVINFKRVQLGLYNFIEYYNEIFNEIGKETANCVVLKEGDIILVKIEENDKYIRCAYLSKSLGNRIECLHLESGRIIETNLDLIKEATDYVKNCPSVIYDAKLYMFDMITTDIKDNKGLALLQKYCQEKEVFILKWQSQFVELFLDSQNLNKQLIHLVFERVNNNITKINQRGNKTSDDQFATVLSLKNSNNMDNLNSQVFPKIFTIKDIEWVPLETGNNVPLLVLDNSLITRGKFIASSVDWKFYKKLSEIKQKIVKHCNGKYIETEYLPIVDELCLAYFEELGTWQRACCLNVENDNKFNLMFLERGTVQVIEAKYIRKMTEEFLFPCYANMCVLADFTQNLVDNAREGIPIDTIITAATVEKAADQEYLVTIEGI